MKELEPLVVKIKYQRNKKWEANKDVAVKKVEKREESYSFKAIVSKIDNITKDFSLQIPENKGTSLDLQLFAPVYMFTMLSQMTIKVPLSEMFRIKEQKNKALEWSNGVKKYTNVASRKITEEKIKSTPKPKEREDIISQIPPKYVDNAMTLVVEDIDPFS